MISPAQTRNTLRPDGLNEFGDRLLRLFCQSGLSCHDAEDAKQDLFAKLLGGPFRHAKEIYVKGEGWSFLKLSGQRLLIDRKRKEFGRQTNQRTPAGKSHEQDGTIPERDRRRKNSKPRIVPLPAPDSVAADIDSQVSEATILEELVLDVHVRMGADYSHIARLLAEGLPRAEIGLKLGVTLHALEHRIAKMRRVMNGSQ